MSPELNAFLNPPKLTAEIVNELFEYDSVNGILRWKISYSHSIKAGQLAGSKTSGKRGGYIAIEIMGKSYKAHRLAWAIYYGIMPTEELVVDHINKKRDDNRINNLRLITDKLNSQNKKRKYSLPLYVYKHREKFAVRIKTDKMRQYGSFVTISEAVERRNKIVKELGLIILEEAA